MVALAIACICWLGVSSVSADITTKPAPKQPPAANTPSQTEVGLMHRYETFYRAYAGKDIPSLQPFYISQLWEALDRTGLARLFAVSALIAERHLVVFAPPLDGAPRIATVLTTLAVSASGDPSLQMCHVTEWKWIQPAAGATENWHIVYEIWLGKLGACVDQFGSKKPRTEAFLGFSFSPPDAPRFQRAEKGSRLAAGSSSCSR